MSDPNKYLREELTELYSAAKDVCEFLEWPETNPDGIPAQFENKKGRELWERLRKACML